MSALAPVGLDTIPGPCIDCPHLGTATSGFRERRLLFRRLRQPLFAPLPATLRGRVDVITIHRPYIAKEEVVDLPLEVRGFEPERTLTDYCDQGTDVLERTAEEAWDWLRPGGWLLVEVSPDRSRRVRGLLQRMGYREVRSTRGWPEISRTVVGRW